MKTLDNMPISHAIALYHYKHQTLKEGNLSKLLEIKKICPDLFDAAVVAEMRNMIEAIETFRASSRYKELRKQDLRERLSIINRDS